MAAAKKKTKPFHFLSLFKSDELAPASVALHVELSWDTLRGIRSLCRLRAGVPILGHRNNRLSQARLQCCFSCQHPHISDPYLHSVLMCPTWHQQRGRISAVRPPRPRNNRQAMYELLNVVPGAVEFADVVSLCAAIDKAAGHFWKLCV